MKTKFLLALLLCFGSIFITTQIGFAQDSTYTVHLRRDFGYGMASDIQGTFTIRLLGDEEQVDGVTFYIDDEVMYQTEEEPFSYQFKTEEFEPGIHRLYAEVVLNDGQCIETSAVQYNFLSTKEANRQIRNVLIGIGGAILGTMAIVAVIQSLVISKDGKRAHQPGTPRNYGILGGTICRKCGRPFQRHIWGINLLVGRLDRCDNCGKWVMTTRATPKALRMAEEAEMEDFESDEKGVEIQNTDEDHLDETKYFDSI
jgi:hypothetical protein